MNKKKRISTSGPPDAWMNPFAAFKSLGLTPTPAMQPTAAPCDVVSTTAKKNRGRVDIIRQTAHRGGKTVTVVTGFTGIGLAEKEKLAKEMQKGCGAGGTVKEGRIEIQGDQYETVARILTNAGFRPVRAGG